MADKILVSGATGLLGSHLLVELSNTDQKILALYRDESTRSEVFSILSYYGKEAAWDSIEWKKGDVLDTQFLLDVMTDVKQVYHCAAMVSFDPSDAVQLHKINVVGTQNMVNAALDNQVSKFLHVSSTATIGNELNGSSITDEEVKWNNDDYHNYYAKSKYSSEREVWRGMEEGLNAVIINPCVIIGPGDPEKSSGAIFSTIANGLKFYTMGGNAFVDARDVAKMMVYLMNSNINNERFLCIGENLTFRDLFSRISDEIGVKPPSIKASKFMTSLAWRLAKIASILSGKKAKITSESARASHKITRFSNQKIKEALNVEFRGIDDAISNTVAYMKLTQKLK
jgi:nucleoside-diphosphate-sugar epimerase